MRWCFFATHASITKTTIHFSRAKTNKDATNAYEPGKMQQVHVTQKKCTHNINIIYLFINAHFDFLHELDFVTNHVSMEEITTYSFYIKTSKDATSVDETKRIAISACNMGKKCTIICIIF